ncbi:response regulator [Methanoplanus sp. FWC-SCC4]|uniref:Response regulator n=1 Tax=Methanochimaera problematica TaxID=2609417 RepID=A0AA97FF77_9EURY|nr:response regulator [Methanoplanus sp. FWC-SCC4]WOF17193.1 response regulator [Methanoplanus sp. FWC-SCC4]
MADAKVLIVEDEVIVAMGLERSLGSFGYDVVGLATNGRDAIKMAKELKPDLALIDINLEDDIDGIEVAGRISKDDIPVIYLTSYTGDDTLSRAILTNPYGYLTKPARPREIYTTIETVLHKHKAIMAEKARKKGEENYHALFNSLPIAASIISTKSAGHSAHFEEVNNLFCGYCGYSREEITEAEPCEVIVPITKDFSICIEDIENTGTGEYEAFLSSKTGDKIRGRILMKGVNFENTSQILTVFYEKNDEGKISKGESPSFSLSENIDKIKESVSSIIAISGLGGGVEMEEIYRYAESIDEILSEK